MQGYRESRLGKHSFPSNHLKARGKFATLLKCWEIPSVSRVPETDLCSDRGHFTALDYVGGRTMGAL